MKRSYANWDSIRTDWINGNRGEAKRNLASMPKKEIFKIVREAIEDHLFADMFGEIPGAKVLLEILQTITKE